MVLPLNDVLPRHHDPRLDWNPRLDERSRLFGVGEVVQTQEDVLKLWTPGTTLDQGSEGACVGFGWTGEAMSSPMPCYGVPELVGNSYGRGVYTRCKQIDEWDGEDYEGTSVLAGAKVMRERGIIGSYRWAFSMEDIRNALIALGPVVIGIPWYNSMYYTDDRGQVIVDPDSGLAGGHCLLLNGYSPRRRWYERVTGYSYHQSARWKNSWGDGYGFKGTDGVRNGHGWVKWSDLEVLIGPWGREACIPMDRKIVRIA